MVVAVDKLPAIPGERVYGAGQPRGGRDHHHRRPRGSANGRVAPWSGRAIDCLLRAGRRTIVVSAGAPRKVDRLPIDRRSSHPNRLPIAASSRGKTGKE